MAEREAAASYAPRLGTKRERLERKKERDELRSIREIEERGIGRGREKGEYLRRVEKPTRVWPDTHTSGPTHGPPAGASFSFASRESGISVCVRAYARVDVYIPPVSSPLALARA